MHTILDRTGTTCQKDNQPIVVNEHVSLVTEHVVRMIKDDGFKKSCIAEEVFEKEPNQYQIIWCLLKHKDANFAVKSERYSLEKVLPFD